MSTEIKSEPLAPEEEAQANPSDEGAPKAETSEERQPPQWEFRKEFRINTQMREMLNLTRKVTELEIDRLRRKVEKLTYGS